MAERLGFIGRASEKPLVAAPFSDYTLPGIGHAGVATALAGAAGIAVILLIFWALYRLFRKSGSVPPSGS